MNASSAKDYLQHYGKIRALRGSVIRSTFRRVIAAFDVYDQAEVENAMRELGLDPESLNCVYCGGQATCWDHLVPAAKEGTHQIRNLAPACTSCNNRKGNKTWADYLQGLEDSPDLRARRNLLESYTKAYEPGESLIVDPEDRKKLDELLDRIHQAMSEADEIVAAAIAKRANGRHGE